jgi:hypothetical protein
VLSGTRKLADSGELVRKENWLEKTPSTQLVGIVFTTRGFPRFGRMVSYQEAMIH